MMRGTSSALPTDDTTDCECSLTSGALAVSNLQAQIDGRERHFIAGRLSGVAHEAELIELIALRGHVLGRISDYEWAAERADQLTRDAPTDGAAFVARARSRGRFHRFADALADLDEAQRLAVDAAILNGERASVFQAIGCYEAALKIYDDTARRRADFASLGALASLHAERGEIATAEQLFDASRSLYRGVSPFPLAQLEFQRGLMWLAADKLRRALTWFEAAVRHLPDYAPAQGHLAEVEAALGKSDAAVVRLLPLTNSSDDPDYAASLAHVLGEAGRLAEAAEWRNRAAERYDELLARHPEAFADHAVEFWLEAGADPDRARRLAMMNFEIRPTARAHKLLARASFLTSCERDPRLSRERDNA